MHKNRTWATENALLVVATGMLAVFLMGCDRPPSSSQQVKSTQEGAGTLEGEPLAGQPVNSTAPSTRSAQDVESAIRENSDLVPSGSASESNSDETLQSVEHDAEKQQAAVSVAAASSPAPSTVEELFEQARREAEYLVDQFPNVPDALELQARIYWIEGRGVDAERIWNQALRLNPDYAYAHNGLGQVAAKTGDFETAAERHLKAAELMPSLSDAVMYATGALTQLGRVQEAIPMLQNLARQTNSPSVWTRLAQAHVAERDYSAAITAFEAALNLNPQDIPSLTGYALALARSDRRSEAMEIQQTLAELRAAQRESLKQRRSEQSDLRRQMREVADKYVLMAKMYVSVRKLEDAERVLRRAALFDPKSQAARVDLAAYFMGTMQAAPAAEVCSELVALDGKNPQYRANYGMMLMRLDRVEDAIKQFEIAVEIRDTAAYWAMLADGYARNKMLVQAKNAIGRAIEKEPSNETWKRMRDQWK